MRFWSREIGGWALIVLGLVVFYRSYFLLTDGSNKILEGGAVTLVGIILFRGGIHLLKVAVAARICLQAQEKLGREQGLAPRPMPTRAVIRPGGSRRFS